MRRRGVVQALCAFGASFLIALLGTGFSFRQVLFVAVALLVGKWGSDVWKKAVEGGPFHRVQFRIELSLGAALVDAGIYTPEELAMVIKPIRNALPGHGHIVFTWLEPRLFFLNNYRTFSAELEMAIELKTFRSGVEVDMRPNDRFELRTSDDGYELVLTSSEQRNEWPRPYQYAGLVLFSFPNSFIYALQGPQGMHLRNKNAREALISDGNLTYQNDPEGHWWQFEGRYGTFKWWNI